MSEWTDEIEFPWMRSARAAFCDIRVCIPKLSAFFVFPNASELAQVGQSNSSFGVKENKTPVQFTSGTNDG
jgi:hypothetical protein